LHRIYVASDGCWLWAKSKSKNGYGLLSVGRKMIKPHRLSWELAIGPIPKGEGAHGTCVCHKCDVRHCVNPAHLFLGSHLDNIRDMEAKGRADHPKGDRTGARTKPERLPWGDRNGSRLHPESRPRGTKHANAKLTEPDIINIRRDPRRQADIAKDFGITQSLVSVIKRRAGWKHIP
jgi:hypothetical protein